MFNALFTLFVASEFCYYLLIAQTGIVEVFHSDIRAFFTLPLGGVMGSLLVYRSFGILDTDQKKIIFFVGLQALCSLFYPSLNLVVLGILGISLGMSAPLLIKLTKWRYTEIAIALGITYAIATALFTYEPHLRGNLAIALSFVALTCSFFIDRLPKRTVEIESEHLGVYAILAMAIWAFLDANLFETLSRSSDISIWRAQTWHVILVFHLVGMAAAYLLRDTFKEHHHFIIALLFALSYMLYAAREAILLSMVYPFVISYYNFIIMKRLSSLGNLRVLGMIMVFTGWIAGGGGLMSALFGYTYIGVMMICVLLCAEIYNFIYQTSQKRINNVQ
ncbi:hypothetical protein [Sulfurospirillum oryzae]|uniref:hypothetical protein n=1 Tax=Sulfurospirillum oryzae TaxID=2976535 RepID=UPI0021E707CD|nr:hypothetical protein [Sulfurospirillum oryzae]